MKSTLNFWSSSSFVANGWPIVFTDVVIMGFPSSFTISVIQCFGILTPSVSSPVVVCWLAAFGFFCFRISVYGPGSFSSSLASQFCVIHSFVGAITEKGFVSLPFISRILFTAESFVASQPSPYIVSVG